MTSQYTFSQVPKTSHPRSNFTRSHGYKTTFDAGYLVPFYVDEVLPGDTFNLNVAILARLATPIRPIMDNLYIDTFFFFVPNRLLWNNWQRFMGEQPNPGDTTDFVVPQVTPAAVATGFAEGSLADYFGIPISVPNLSVNALPFRAYNLIFNEWFRDQNLQTRETVNVGDGADTDAIYYLKKRAKRHDYFTGALPWPQKGPGVEIPLGTKANIKTEAPDSAELTIRNAQNAPRKMHTSQPYLLMDDVLTPPEQALYADLSTATAATINSLREAFQMQRLYERDARGGTRYTEILRSHFGVESPDARLQRPEYLGGSSQPVIINPVTQTAPTGTYAATPQGNLAGYGVSAGDRHGFTKSFVEHGYVIGLVMARGDVNYQQGINRMWNRQTRFDYYWPVLSHLGEQAILNKEIYAQGTGVLSTTPDPDNPGQFLPWDELAFGYQERWAEYRYYPNLITGLFRSNAAAPLDTWHIGYDFQACPTLADAFIQEDPPLDRVVATPDEPHFIMDCWFNVLAARPMPLYSVPGLIDHF